MSESNFPCQKKLDEQYSLYVSSQLPIKEQVDFIQTIIDLDLQEKYCLQSVCKYFILEGLCYEVPSIGDND